MVSLTQFYRRPSDGRMMVNALPYARHGWELLRVTAMTHEDGHVRIAAAEAMIRLADEFAPPASAVYEMPESDDHPTSTDAPCFTDPDYATFFKRVGVSNLGDP